MADPNRRFRLAAITLPLFFLAMSGLARATIIFVDTTDDGSVPSHCTLIDAVQAAKDGRDVILVRPFTDAEDVAGVAFKRADDLAGGNVEQLGHPISGSAGERRAVG